MEAPQLKIRLQFQQQTVLGPGKLALLQAIAQHGSISAAAKSMHMSYRRAWELVDVMNQSFNQPVVVGISGGAHGGGAQVTPFGLALIAHYQQLLILAAQAVTAELDWITQALKPIN